MNAHSIRKQIVFTLLGLSLIFQLFAQEKNCDVFKDGTFHFYEKTSGQHITIANKKNISKQYFDTGDSTSWRLKRISGCRFTMQYLSGSVPLTKKEEKLLFNNFLAYEVNTVDENYFTYTLFLDDYAGKVMQKDTIWLKEKPGAPLPVTIENVSLDKNIVPDSSFALVYVYRPYKLIGFAVYYPIFFDEYPVCKLRINTGYGFKVKKEGNLKVRSTIYGKETILDIDVKKGSTYYIHTELKTGMVTGKVGMELQSQQDAEKELAKIREHR